MKDTGIGIPSAEVDRVLDRFYQVDSSHTRSHEGTGIGMALAKELVELHGGKISVESIEGKGTTISVSLPMGESHFQKAEIVDIVNVKPGESFSEFQVDLNSAEDVPSRELVDQPTLLIVEDNADMRHYIRKNLSADYNILEAENGKIGVSMALESVPDLVISDIMMPCIDGFKLCSILKTNELTSHIPVILLTAKADTESKLQGLDIGADDYLSKPFDAHELRLLVRNRISAMRKMRERFSREITIGERHVAITSLDERFLTRLIAIIDTHLDNEHFSIEQLSKEIGLSNTHLYRKVKALYGQTPSDLLRSIRLKRAADLLEGNNDNVTQIAFSVGFSSQSYFNKCFKEKYGMTPGQFKKQQPVKATVGSPDDHT